ncbi:MULTISPECIES: SGNH/GDSL hydrolase family protein [unclassified Pedobacter]|uniref:SGNH/GDSL hydrolase family protein n=1 Tax=unclassified Pedobacter TaxID=2628915 RepID=UPI001D728504|nr:MULTISPECIES: SGNH/GDSL hydrolase family protein [unclassified Pedobacter]CAH0152291.1 Acetylxylan esterase [Pedobacter sp. Bi36]CAH0208443.1 Acetylxylan esterase [Pedobacter sp. Bi126]
MKINRRQVIKGSIALLSTSLFRAAPTYAINYTAEEQESAYLVINAGVGGNNTADLLNRVEEDCLRLHPKLTILMVGTNDMNSVKHIPIDEYERNLDTLVKNIKSKGCKVLLMTILPVYEVHLLTRHPAQFYQPEGVAGRRMQINNVIRKIAEQQKTHFLDLGHQFSAIGKIGTDKDSLIQNIANSNKTDGIHPTANGYRFIAVTVYDYIIDHRLPKTNIVCFGDSITKGDGTIDKDSYPAYLIKLLTAP